MAYRATHLTPDLLAFFGEWLPGPPARVLDVGCGAGAMTEELAGRGYEVTGVDPQAPEGPAFVGARLEDFAPDAPFDAAVALRSLHHVDDLERAVESLWRALQPDARVVVLEWAVERLDDSVWKWLAQQGLEDDGRRVPPHVIPLEAVMNAMGQRFALLFEERGTFLARERGREDLHAAEEAAIAAGELQALGARIVYERVG
jgi:ubiquinone/menaquinone biosynthesis C-methylase UbiE